MSRYYWRTSTGQEVDFILGDMEVAVDIKASRRVNAADTKGLMALCESHSMKRLIIVSLDDLPKQLDNKVDCLPWEIFLKMLWAGEVI